MPDFTPLKPKIVLGIVAHPDDLEFGVAGTIAKYVQQGAEAYYYILTNGNKGSDDRTMTPEKIRDVRRCEQRTAANSVPLQAYWAYRKYFSAIMMMALWSVATRLNVTYHVQFVVLSPTWLLRSIQHLSTLRQWA